eukprot:GHVL01019332.1.p1 GENE.GHVL01019332.1~~GHVL01019332.1.p1  ORF type:complete len:866 (+),score=140.87 GHVL01019332.1:95-2692(+)
MELDEDNEMIKQLDTLVEQLQGKDEASVMSALEQIAKELKSATISMTSVPKPLKFLIPHFETLVTVYESWNDSPAKKYFSDILSVLSTTLAPNPEKPRQALYYRLKGTKKDLLTWGNEYLRNIAGEIADEYKARKSGEESFEECLSLVEQIVPHEMKHNAECEAVDLLSEVDQIEQVEKYVDENTYQRVCRYMLACAPLLANQEESKKILNVIYNIYLKHKEYCNAIRIAMKLIDEKKIENIFKECKDRVTQKQLALMLWQQRLYIVLEDEDLNSIASGEKLSEYYQALAKDLDLLEPKSPEEIYKSHLEETKHASVGLESAKQNLASTYVNAFVNAGFCKDKLMTPEGTPWLYKNKDHGMMSAAASVGLLLLWNVQEGLCQIDKFQYCDDDCVKAGALLAFGLGSAGVRSEIDAPYNILKEQLDSKTVDIRRAAIVGLGYAYAGTRRDDLLDLLTPLVIDTSNSTEIAAMAALSLGLIYVGSGNEDAVQAVLQALIDRHEQYEAMKEKQTKNGEKESKDVSGLCGMMSTFFGVGLGLLFLGLHEECEGTLQALSCIDELSTVGKYAKKWVQLCAWTGTGDVLQVQEAMQCCSDKCSSDDESSIVHSLDVLRVPLIGMSEEVGSDMTLRMLDHVLQYGELPHRRAVPLALALQSASNPKPPVIESLSKLSHDADADVALNAILCLGIVGAGTNNSRIAGLLRQLAGFYARDSSALFIVRIAQGLLFMGKGQMTLSPLVSDRLLINPVAIASILVLINAALWMRTSLLGRHHYFLFHLVGAMRPRMLITVDEDLNMVNCPTRVGTAVDVIGQAGRPKTITGFQTHSTPVLLSFGERAEFVSDEYIPVSPILEGVVIVRKNDTSVAA